MSETQLTVDLEVAVTDGESSAHGVSGDGYVLTFADGTFEGVTKISYTGGEDSPWNHTVTGIPPREVPGRVADVFEEYIDAAAVGFQTTDDPVQTLGAERAVITISHPETATDYRVEVLDRRVASVRVDGAAVSGEQVPTSVVETAREFLPSGTLFPTASVG